MQEAELTWASKLKEEGREEGRREGRRIGFIEGKRGTLLRPLMAKFGPLPNATSSRVEALQSLDEFDSYLDRVLKATLLEEVGLESCAGFAAPDTRRQ